MNATITRTENADGTTTYTGANTDVEHLVIDLGGDWAQVARFVGGHQIGDATATDLERAHEDAARLAARS